jgi:RimJ/RimL family protein N-acetyltransferase
MMIKTKRLIIRKFLAKDALDLYEYLSLESVYEYEPGGPIDLEEANSLVEGRAITDNFYAVELAEEGKMIGHLYFQQQEPKEFMTWEIGYIFNPRYYRKGYATEAARALIEYAFDNFATHRIIGKCNPNNIASCRVLEKIGMIREGTFRQKAFFRRDAAGEPLWFTGCEYAVLKEDLLDIPILGKQLSINVP